MERLEDANDSRVHELQADLIALRNELKTLQSNSINDKQSKRETFAGLTEENEKLHSDLQKVSFSSDKQVKSFEFGRRWLPNFHSEVKTLQSRNTSKFRIVVMFKRSLFSSRGYKYTRKCCGFFTGNFMCKYMAMTSFRRIRFYLRNSILLESIVIREAGSL